MRRKICPLGRGIPRALHDLTVLLPYRDEAAFDLIRKHKDELALVFIEGVQSSNPKSDVGDFLSELRDVCAACGVLFGIDEVITGFRVAYDGAQGLFDVKPDIATYGKVIGGGLPVGAVTGRADLMDVFTGLQAEKGVFSGGTFSGNPLTMEAGAAALLHLKDHPEIYTAMNEKADRLASGVNQFCEQEGIPVQMKQVASMFHLFFQSEPVDSMRDLTGEHLQAQKAFYLHCLNRGVLVPGTQRAFLCAAHGDQEVDQLLKVFTESLADTAAEGLFA
jgi:glutamate-1-semialdehyde 2,1-aminomutase